MANRAILTFGRFNPPTIGHERLLKTLITASKREDADAVMFLSHTQDSKNPLTYAQKKRIISATFPALTFVPEDIRTPFDALTHLKKQGYSVVHLYVGEDRTKDFTDMVGKWHRKEDPDKTVVFVVKTLPRQGNMDPEKVSGTAARALARKGDVDGFREILMSGGKSQAEDLVKKIQTKLGSLTEAFDPKDEDEDDDEDTDQEIELGGSEDDDDADGGADTPDDDEDAPEGRPEDGDGEPDDPDDEDSEELDLDGDGDEDGHPVDAAMNSFFKMGDDNAPDDPRLVPEDEPTPDIVIDIQNPDDSDTSYLVLHPPTQMISRMTQRAEYQAEFDLDGDGHVGITDTDGNPIDEDDEDKFNVPSADRDDEDTSNDEDDDDFEDEDDDEDDDEEMELDLDDDDDPSDEEDDDESDDDDESEDESDNPKKIASK